MSSCICHVFFYQAMTWTTSSTVAKSSTLSVCISLKINKISIMLDEYNYICIPNERISAPFRQRVGLLCHLDCQQGGKTNSPCQLRTVAINCLNFYHTVILKTVLLLMSVKSVRWHVSSAAAGCPSFSSVARK